MAVTTILGRLLELVIPLTCGGCRLPGIALCDECDSRLVRISPHTCCNRCGHPWPLPVPRCPECPPHLTVARQAVIYDDPAPMIFRAFKDEGRERLADELASRVAYQIPPPRPGTPLVPVPASRDRERDRGFNPAHTIAEALAERWDCPVVALLERRGRQRAQRGSRAPERHVQVRDAFRPTIERSPPVMLLVDDVMTTGATLATCAWALRSVGARHVGAVAFARVVRRQ